MSFPWHSNREWNPETTFYEKVLISEKIKSLAFNTDGGKFLVSISGDYHMLSYDTGFHNEDYGAFPMFQCAALDSPASCKQGGYTEDPYMYRGQFCHFAVT